MEKKNFDEIELDIKWQGQPAGLWGRFLSLIHMNFTVYQISSDELIIKTGFFSRKTDTIELYLLKDPDMTENLYQKILGIGTITVIVDTHCNSTKAGSKLKLKNVKDCEKVRKFLRDAIETDVLERKVTYFDKV